VKPDRRVCRGETNACFDGRTSGTRSRVAELMACFGMDASDLISFIIVQANRKTIYQQSGSLARSNTRALSVARACLTFAGAAKSGLAAGEQEGGPNWSNFLPASRLLKCL
jgi:hypothetical protein